MIRRSEPPPASPGRRIGLEGRAGGPYDGPGGAMDLVRTAAALFQSPSRPFAVALWEGTVLPPAREEGVSGRIALRQPRALEAFLPPSEHRLSEAFLDGDIELEGDAIGLLEAAARWEGPPARASMLPAALRLLVRRG